MKLKILIVLSMIAVNVLGMGGGSRRPDTPVPEKRPIKVEEWTVSTEWDDLFTKEDQEKLEMRLKQQQSDVARDKFYPDLAQAKTPNGAKTAYEYFGQLNKLPLAHGFTFGKAYQFVYEKQEDPASIAIKRCYSRILAKAFELRDPKLSPDQMGDEVMHAHKTVLCESAEIFYITKGALDGDRKWEMKDFLRSIAQKINNYKSDALIDENEHE